MLRHAVLITFILLLSPGFAWPGDPASKPLPLSRVNDAYKSTIRPIFSRKCFDCHSDQTNFPWYVHLPVIQQLIQHDIREARADMDLSEDFPFRGKGTPTDYLDVIRDAVNDHSMPPFRYRILHRGSELTDSERAAILNWVDQSEQELTLGQP